MSLVRIHCWSCARSIEVEQGDPNGGLAAGGWALSKGETYCPGCAAARGLAPASGSAPEAPQALLAQGGDEAAGQAGEQFPNSAYASGEGRFARSVRMMKASWRVLRENPGLMAFPVISVVLSLLVGVFCFSTFGSWATHGGRAVNGARDGLLVPSLIAAYPLTFISIYFSVALAEVLAGRLDGKETTTAEGFSAANSRIGLIAAWSLLACTVGLALRALEQRLPLAGRIAAWLFGMAWSLATIFAVPILAYEGLGPLETVKRSAADLQAPLGCPGRRLDRDRRRLGRDRDPPRAGAVRRRRDARRGWRRARRARRCRALRARRGGLGDGADLPRLRLPQRRRHGHLARALLAGRPALAADQDAARPRSWRASSTSSRTPKPDAPLPT